MLYRIVHAVLWVMVRSLVALFGGLRVEGRENVPRHGPVILAPNHISLADPAVLGAVLPRFAHYMATDELFTIRVLGPLARLMRAFPIRQDSPDRAALRHTRRLLEQGEAVVIFPEGHVSPDGHLKPIQPGMVMVAIHAGAPVVPVGIQGTDKMVPYRRFWPRPAGRRMTIRFGRPISAEELAGGMKGRAAIDHGARVLHAAIAALLDEPAYRPLEQPALASTSGQNRNGAASRTTTPSDKDGARVCHNNP